MHNTPPNCPANALQPIIAAAHTAHNLVHINSDRRMDVMSSVCGNLQEAIVSSFKCALRAIIVAWISLASGLAAPPEARSQPGSGTIADQESIFIDGQTFNIVPLPAKPD